LLDLEAIKNVQYLHEFDREVQGPTWGYPTEGAYYRDASSVDSLLAVRIPLLAINAADDPIAADEAVPYGEFKQTPHAVLCTTSLGGHLSWFQIGGKRWHAQPAVNFLNNMAFEYDPVAVSQTDNGDEAKGKKSPFNPMRRRLYLSSSTDQ